MLKPVLRAVEAGGRTVDDPTEEALHDLLSEMNLSHRFVIRRGSTWSLWTSITFRCT